MVHNGLISLIFLVEESSSACGDGSTAADAVDVHDARGRDAAACPGQSRRGDRAVRHRQPGRVTYVAGGHQFFQDQGAANNHAVCGLVRAAGYCVVRFVHSGWCPSAVPVSTREVAQFRWPSPQVAQRFGLNLPDLLTRYPKGKLHLFQGMA